jgi:hypothetical protein
MTVDIRDQRRGQPREPSLATARPANDVFISSIEKTYAAGIDVIRRKNADYAKSEDPFRNFRLAEVAGVDVGRAILVRALDKMSRISNLLDRNPPAVIDEKLEDTLLDCINYLAILKAWIELGQKS